MNKSAKLRKIIATRKTVLAAIRTHRPADVVALQKLYRLRPLSEGAYRETFLIHGTDIVVKIPLGKGSYGHARKEFERIATFRKYKSLRKHMPKVYHFDPLTHVTCMRYYPKGRKLSERAVCAFSEVLDNIVYELTGHAMQDIQADNVRYHKGTLIFIDLGL
jgi:hypothetical protein